MKHSERSRDSRHCRKLFFYRRRAEITPATKTNKQPKQKWNISNIKALKMIIQVSIYRTAGTLGSLQCIATVAELNSET